MQISSYPFQEFTGNRDRSTVQKNNVESLPRTKFIRFRPTAKRTWPTLRVEIYGAAQGSSHFYILHFEFTCSMCWILVFVELCIEGSGMDGQLTIFLISVDVRIIRKLMQSWNRLATNLLVLHPGILPDGYYSGREAPSLNMGCFLIFNFYFFRGSTPALYADWLACRQYVINVIW